MHSRAGDDRHQLAWQAPRRRRFLEDEGDDEGDEDEDEGDNDDEDEGEDESNDETDVNTDMGNVEPIKGPRFYSTVLHETWKRNRQLDKYAIDPRRTAVVLFVRRWGSTHVDFPGIEMTHPRAV